MNKKYSYLNHILLLAVTTITMLQSCKEEEFIAEPVGEEFPALEYPLLTDALEESGFTLFTEAWKRSNIESFIEENYTKTQLTVLVPDNKAMQAAGYNEASIASAQKADLDTLIRYHVLVGEVSPEQLKTSPSAQTFYSLLNHPFFVESTMDGSAVVATPYRYQHVLQATDEGLSDNGLVLKNGEDISVQNGRIIPIDKLIDRPEKSMADVLRSDPRFRLFSKVMEINKEIYDIGTTEYWHGVNFSPFVYFMESFPYYGSFNNSHIIRFTLFAPTDAAFNAIGIYTTEDIIALNNRGSFEFSGYMTPSDSLLSQHKIGTANIQASYEPEFPFGAQADNLAANAVFYSPSLNNRLLQDYILRVVNGQPEYLGFDFGRDASGRVTVKQSASTAEPATVIEENINTLQGPIHVVDRIIVPEGFSMWHK